MSSIPWVRRRVQNARPTTPLAADARSLDVWLDTVHRLAQGRAAERASLVEAGRALRARLRRAE